MKVHCHSFLTSILALLIICKNFAESQSSRGFATTKTPLYKRATTYNPLLNSRTISTATPPKSSAAGHPDTLIQGIYVLDPSEAFCRNNPKQLFYQRISDGAVCCRGKQLPVVTTIPETTGECAISTKTDSDGMLDPENLWCSYSCSLKKMGAIDKEGRVVPEVYFNHLSDGLTIGSKNKIKAVMTTYLSCYKKIKNTKFPCYTPMNFQKCFLDALFILCKFDMPKPQDLPKIKKLGIFNLFSTYGDGKLDYENLTPACAFNQRKVSAGCCHKKPLPWTPTEIMEATSNQTKMNECLKKMGHQCDATCFLHSVGAVNAEMELDVAVFQKEVLHHFPTVKASGWMDYLGPVFLFYDEMLADMGDESSDTAHRVCRFHDRIMELHESKVEQYCSMTQKEVKELINSKPASK